MLISNVFYKIYNKYITNIHTIKTHLTEEEKFILNKKVLPSSCCVEIGSYLGASSCCIASSKNCKILYCIDTWKNDAMSEGVRDTFAEFLENTDHLKKKIIPLRQDSLQAGTHFNKIVDFLFIDGDHSYEGVKKDIKIWMPKLRSGGVLIMHDSGWAEGVQRVIKEDVIQHMIKYKYTTNMFIGVYNS